MSFNPTRRNLNNGGTQKGTPPKPPPTGYPTRLIWGGAATVGAILGAWAYLQYSKEKKKAQGDTPTWDHRIQQANQPKSEGTGSKK